MFWVYVLENTKGQFYIGHRDNLGNRVTSHNRTDKISGNLREKTDRGRWCGLNSIQIAQALCDASAKLKTGNLHV